MPISYSNSLVKTQKLVNRKDYILQVELVVKTDLTFNHGEFERNL